MKVSKRMKDFLLFMKSEQPVCLFPVEWSPIWKKAEKEGLIESSGRENGMFGLTKFSLTKDGENAL